MSFTLSPATSHSYSYNVNEVTTEEQVSNVNNILWGGIVSNNYQLCFCCVLVALTAMITSAWLVQYAIYPGQTIYVQKDNGETN
jgi:hypothetical protein